jgi:hypothetical protein
MHKFLVYSLDTGRVLRTGTTGAIDHIDIQARQSEAVEVDYPDGVQANGRWLRTADGYYYEQPIPAAVAESELWAEVRWKRTALLAQSDWTQMPDVPAQTSAKWQAYRQALRDITTTFTSPDAVVWPEQP